MGSALVSPLVRTRAISVDLDGTLYRVRRLRVAFRLRKSRSVLVAFLEARERIRREGPFPSKEDLFLRELEMVAESMAARREVIEPVLRQLYETLPDALTRGSYPYAGVRESLLAAVDRGLAIAVLSDYAPRQKLVNLGLADLPWAVAVGGEELGALKPHARGFLEVAERLGVAPGEIIHIGDREDLDVEGARAAGAVAWRFQPKHEHPTQAARSFSRWTPTLFADVRG